MSVPINSRRTVYFATNRSFVGGSVLFDNNPEDERNPEKHKTGKVEVKKVSNQNDSGWQIVEGSFVVDQAARETASASKVNTALDQFLASSGEDYLPHVGQNGATGGATRVPRKLLYVHGYSSSFVNAIERAAEISAAYEIDDVFAICWPADGEASPISPAHYKRDQAMAAFSAPAIAASVKGLFERVREIQKAREMDLRLVVHSMGNFALSGAIQILKASDTTLLSGRIFRHALLMAADEDYDALINTSRLAPLADLSGGIVVYRSTDDIALTVSTFVNGRERLGMVGPFGAGGEVPASVTSIDCTTFGETTGDVPNGEKHYGHQYYRLSPEVINDVLQVLDDVPPSDIEPRIRDPTDVRNPQAFKIPRYAHGSLRTLSKAAAEKQVNQSGDRA